MAEGVPKAQTDAAKQFLSEVLAERRWETAEDPSIQRGEPMGFFPYIVKHGITDAIGSELTQVSCAPFMDTLWFCFVSPFHQFPHFYKAGGADKCIPQYQECTACFAIKNKTPAQVREYLESKFGPAAAEASGEEKRLSSEELWGAPIWNHDDPSGGLGNSTAG